MNDIPVPSPLALRARQAAAALGISPRSLWALTVPRGPIPAIRVGRGKRRITLYPVSELEKWLTEQAAKPEVGER
jgi:hypothetical protein